MKLEKGQVKVDSEKTALC